MVIIIGILPEAYVYKDSHWGTLRCSAHPPWRCRRGIPSKWAEDRAGWVGQAEGLTAQGAQLPMAAGLEKGSVEGRATAPPSAAIAALWRSPPPHAYPGPVCSFHRRFDSGAAAARRLQPCSRRVPDRWAATGKRLRVVQAGSGWSHVIRRRRLGAAQRPAVAVEEWLWRERRRSFRSVGARRAGRSLRTTSKFTENWKNEVWSSGICCQSPAASFSW